MGMLAEKQPELENFLRQRKDEKTTLDEGYDQLAKILGINNWRG